MKRKLIYLLVFLVVVAAAIGPAIYMQKVFGSDQQVRPAESVDAAGHGSTEGSGPSVTETKQGDPISVQQSAAPAADARANAAAVQVTSDAAPDVPAEGGCLVWIAVVGKNGEQLFPARQVAVKKDNKWGITALGALETSGITYITSPTWPDFVYSISGQANSGVSGWMYSVNGDIPMHMADRHPVKTGDRVIWWYSNSMEQPQPRWDELIQ
jgi:hypothetical protein